MTIGKRLDANRGIGPGFDFLRIALALSIVAFHSLSVTGQYYPLDDTPMWMIHYMLVPMFFALSGFLVTASAGRLTLPNFLVSRGLRIVPALAVDTFVCALIIVPLFTTLPLRAYFTNAGFPAYFLNIVGWVHFTLPGVFSHFPVARVNGALWTIPFELLCYLIISVLIVTRAIEHRFLVFSIVVAYLLVSVGMEVIDLPSLIQDRALHGIVQLGFIDHEAQAVTAFLCGIIAYQNRYNLPYRGSLFALSIGVMIASAFLLSNVRGSGPEMRFILMPAITYMTVFIGLTRITLPGFFRSGDYSYGIYLYHMPLLQVVLSLFPALGFARHFGAGFTLLIGLPLIIGVATLSWHLVEKPTLRLRKRLFFPARAHQPGALHAAATQAAAPKPVTQFLDSIAVKASP